MRYTGAGVEGGADDIVADYARQSLWGERYIRKTWGENLELGCGQDVVVVVVAVGTTNVAAALDALC